MQADILRAKSKDVGGIPVARLLPQGKRRTIGAWCFLDHAGPATFAEHDLGLQVGAHPHTNLQTFTWMLQGEVWHQDSLGYRQLIRRKQVNLMTAGTGAHRGIAHTEQTPSGGTHLHAVQLWIALPMNQDIAAGFEHHPELPGWHEDGVEYILTTGEFAGHRAPTTQYSPLLGIDMQFSQSQNVTIAAQPGWEYGLLVIAGKAGVGEVSASSDELLTIDHADHSFTLHGEAGTHLMLLGGEPLPHPTVIWWNFVADSKAAVEQAVHDWNNGSARFGAEIDLHGTTLKRLRAPDVPQGLR